MGGWCSCGPTSAPRVNDKRIDEASGEGKAFLFSDSAAVVSPLTQDRRGVAGVGPVLFCSSAGLSASTVSGLCEQWQEQQRAFASVISKFDYVYWWADGIHVNMRLGEDSRVCWC